METQPKLTPQMFIFVLQELLRTPGINRVNLIQIVQPGGGGLIMDALGQALPSDPRIVSRMFTPEQDLNHEYTTKHPLIFEKNILGINYEVWGQLPKKPPIMPAPGAINFLLQKARGDKPIPIVLMWLEFNLETFEYRAISQGPPLCEQLQPNQMN